jgi:hypothetical protein
MRKPYIAPTLSRYGTFGDLTKGGGKTISGNDLLDRHGEGAMCNPNADPTSQVGCIS